MTIQRLSLSSDQQASRLRRIPSQVEELIKVATLVPPDCELPGPFELLERYGHKGCEDFIKQLPKKKFRKFLSFIGPFDSRNPAYALEQYVLVRDARELLQRIARMDDKKAGQIVQHVTLFGSASRVILQVNESGRIDIKHDRLLELLKCVDVARIRECQVCKYIFWAGRSDQKCCSTDHAKVLRTREWRKKYAENYKL